MLTRKTRDVYQGNTKVFQSASVTFNVHVEEKSCLLTNYNSMSQ